MKNFLAGLAVFSAFAIPLALLLLSGTTQTRVALETEQTISAPAQKSPNPDVTKKDIEEEDDDFGVGIAITPSGGIGIEIAPGVAIDLGF